MTEVNILRENHDPFYRYKMPLIQAKTEGRGNGIKTNVLNAAEVARALARPVSYVIKYFGFELGAQTSIDEDKERFLINGVHDANKLQDTLDGFISKFILCASCKNPETVLGITKNGKITKDCKACGEVSQAPSTSRLSTFIEKNPPKKEKNKKSATASENVVGGGKSISDIAAKQKTAQEESAHTELPPSQKVVVKDDDWAVDVSEEAVKARALEMEALNINSDIQKFDDFGSWFLEQDEFPDDIEIYKKISDLGIVSERKTIEVLAQVLFSEDIVNEIEEHTGLLRKIINGSAKSEKSLLGGIERLIGTQHPTLEKSVPKILMTLYDNEIVGEDVIKDWGTHVSKKYVPKETSKRIRKAAKPFLKWLQEADEEDSESDEE